MTTKIFQYNRVPDDLLATLDSRDVALWIRNFPTDPSSQEALVAFLGLPWRLIVSESYSPTVFSALEAARDIDDPMVRKRGFTQIIDTNPSNIDLPERCLPIYLLNGRLTGVAPTDFESRLRHMTMLETVRRSSVRSIFVLAGDDEPVSNELRDLWSSGFRSFLTFVSTALNADDDLQRWLDETPGTSLVSLIPRTTTAVIEDVIKRYIDTYPDDRIIVRVRDRRANVHKIDVTRTDEPERPLLDRYSLIRDRDLTLLVPEELSQQEFIEFFQDSEASWRPYAAGVPWVRDADCKKTLLSYLRKIETTGPDENRIAYIKSESGAGGTTLARALAWECAREGYLVLVAKPVPFVPDSLPVVNFINRVQNEIELQLEQDQENGRKQDAARQGGYSRDHDAPRYEVPWVIVFDQLHWQYRDDQILAFRHSLEKSGRMACILVVTDTYFKPSLFTSEAAKMVAELNHTIGEDEARDLGHHLNKFLRVHGRERPDWEWDRFASEHTVQYLEGMVAFWVSLSFWIQGQYDLTESIQQWIYRSFKTNCTERDIQDAILEIAALSSEQLPLPEALLPETQGEWPVSHRLDDSRASLAALGLVHISAHGEKHWALVHDILGRFLLNALFYDFPMREALGFGDVRNAEHLRFQLLRRISQKPELGTRTYTWLGEDFATTLFKIDPDHGRGSYALMWREVLDALDKMPGSLRNTSRVFRHHISISRRRIAKLDEYLYGVTMRDKIGLLEEAVKDIKYALDFIPYSPGSESNLNLFNSLANAYFDLADAEMDRGSPDERVAELRRLASEATRSAYEENPTNSFVIETYVKNLLQYARESSERAVSSCIEALGILFSALTSNEATYRAAQLGALADKALDILFQHIPSRDQIGEPTSPVDVLVKAWTTLSDGRNGHGVQSLSDLPRENQLQALDVLSCPVGQGNMQVIRLSYDLVCICDPYNFQRQLEFAEQLVTTNYRMSPQLRLEYAILLFQRGRYVEGDKMFKFLRQLWRESDYLVFVPDRLRWLRSHDGRSLQTVQAISSSDYGNRSMALVIEFGNTLVPFRPEEQGIRDMRPGTHFTCHVSFGHNGSFLRPVTAGPTKIN